MKRLILWVLLACAAFCALPAQATIPVTLGWYRDYSGYVQPVLGFHALNADGSDAPSGSPTSPVSASDPNNAAIFYNLTPSHVASGTAYPYASYPVRILESTCTVATPVTVTLQGDGTGTGGTVTETLPAQSVPFQQILAAWKVTEVTAGALAANCVLDLVK